MISSEPPSSIPCRSSRFLVGRNSRGNWVVQEQKGLCGGLFIGRNEALRFALFETGNRPEAVIMVPGVLELDMSSSAARIYRPKAEPAALRYAA